MNPNHELLDVTTTGIPYELNDTELSTTVERFPHWELVEDMKFGYQLRRKFQFQSSHDIIQFVNKLNAKSSELHHVPDIIVIGDVVIVTCYTEGVYRLTRNDTLFAAHADVLYAK